MNDPLEQLNPADEESYLVRLLLTATTSQLRDEALTQVAADDFASGHLGGIWETAQKLQADGDKITRRSLVKATGNPTAAEHALHRLGDAVPRAAEFPAAVAEVQRCGKLRRILEATTRIQQRVLAAEDHSQALSWAFDELTKLDTTEQSNDTRGYRELLDSFEQAMRTASSTHTIVSTPWPEVNERIAGGLHPGRLYVPGAQTGHGKSILGYQLAEHAASKGHPALIFSVEMGALEVTGRNVANGASIEMGEIARRELSDHSWKQFAEYRARAADYPLFVNDRPDLSLAYLKAECRAQKRRTGLAMVCVDYLQLLKTDRGQSREREVAHISRTLKQLSRELDIAVVVPAQLNRRPTERGKPMLSDLRESGAIEQDSDVVFLLARQFHTDGELAGKPTGFVTLDIQKNRHGRIGEIELPWRAHYSRIG
jgi:replicative DNA helicase